MCLAAVWLLTLGSVTIVYGGGSKANQKLFVDVDSIGYVDPRKDGFLIALNKRFVENHLRAVQIPTLFVTAVPLKRISTTETETNDRVSKIIYPEDIRDGETIEIDRLREKSWYFVCVEFENYNRHNETMGATCKLFRTADKFGSVRSAVTDPKLAAVLPSSLRFEAAVEADFPMRLTFFLTNYEGEAKVYVVKRDVSLNVTFGGLKEDTDYGRICIYEEPLVSPYTVTGRLIDVRLEERCYFEDSLRTTVQIKLPPSPELSISSLRPEPGRKERYSAISGSEKLIRGFIYVYLLTIIGCLI